MLVSIFLIITFFSYVILASPNGLQIVEHLGVVPALWHPSRVVNPAHVFQLSIALQRDNHVAEILYNISTPGHTQYGQHLTREEAQSLLSPDADSHQDIMSWLGRNNITDIKNDAHWIRFNATVEQANNMLAADFRWYRSSESHKEVLRTLKYSVPRTLHSRISLVSPTTRFCSMKMMTAPHIEHHEMKRDTKSIHMEKRATVDPSCNRTITPNCLRALYNVPTNVTLSNARGVGVYASQNQVAKFKDFNLFLQNVDPSVAGSNFTFRSINGGITDQNDTVDSDEETNFDVQYAAALSFPIPNVIFSIGGQGPIQPELGNEPGDGTEPWLQWLDAILVLPDDQLPHTITTSFGENEQSLPNGYVQQVCNQFGALGARGVSFIAASGDSGPGAACVTNDGTNSTRFTAIFPGSCPFVTAVGGVKGVNPEIAVSFSAGGFSDKFARPTYQDNSVPAYLKTLGNQFDGLFNASGRGFPDVSAQSFNLTFVTEGRVGGFAGTSAASPTWAGLVGMVNGALIAQNKAPLGFLNPWLYSTGLSAMNDITLGGSVGCTGNNPFTNQPLPAVIGPKLVANAGWNATVGWDPVTGMGTPNVAKMLEIAMMGNTTKRSIH